MKLSSYSVKSEGLKMEIFYTETRNSTKHCF